ncbi:hypothetical protein [Helicobacter sp. 23-1045]
MRGDLCENVRRFCVFLIFMRDSAKFVPFAESHTQKFVILSEAKYLRYYENLR